MTNLPAPTDLTLAQLEDRIADGLTCAGEALAEIRIRKLYLADYASFDDYCREKWGIAGRTALRKIAQAVATKALPAGAPVPSQRALERGNQPEVADDAGRVDARVHSSDAPDVPSRTIVARPLDTISPDAVLTGSAPREAASTGPERPTPPPSVLTPPAPPDRLPSLRQQASTVIDVLQDAEEGCGAKWTPEQATYFEGRAAREMANWRRAHGLGDKPVPRSPGRVIKPEDRLPTRAAPPASIPAQSGAPARSLARREVVPMFKEAK